MFSKKELNQFETIFNKADDSLQSIKTGLYSRERTAAGRECILPPNFLDV